jgi:NAD+ diphosphatase
MSDHPSAFGPWPSLAYVDSRLDRAAGRRGDPGLLAAAEADPATRLYVVGGESIVLARRGEKLDPLFRPAEAMAFGPAVETVFLGLADKAARIGHGIAPEAAAQLKMRPDLLVTDLRSIAVQGLISPALLPPLAAAKAVLAWHARHSHCANCGAPTKSTEAGWRRDCDACGVYHFPRTDPCVIMLAIDGERCLLAHQSRFAAGMWSCLAGFVEPGETLEEAVRRETFEEAGVKLGRVRYFASQPWPFPMSLMVGYHAEAVSRELVIDRTEIEDARWVSRAEADLMLARQHPDKLYTPPPSAIAHHLIRAYVEEGAGILASSTSKQAR